MLTGQVKLDQLLKSTSSAFYLSLRILPKHVRKPISLAYLLARAADTITDAPNISEAVKIQSLISLKYSLNNDSSDMNISHFTEIDFKDNLSKVENQLICKIPFILTCILSLKPENCIQVKRVVLTLIEGMEMDLKYFGKTLNSPRLVSLKNNDELDKYTYLVAGCVGSFWTEITLASESKICNINVTLMSALGVEFGKALQMTNILRDFSSDIRLGKCYIPDEELNKLNLNLDDLLTNNSEKQIRQLISKQIHKTLDLYDSAEKYFLSIPPRKVRLRLAVLWPLILGLGTLNAIVTRKNWHQSESVTKVSRLWVYKMMLKSLFLVSLDYVIKSWFRQLRSSITQHLHT